MLPVNVLKNKQLHVYSKSLLWFKTLNWHLAYKSWGWMQDKYLIYSLAMKVILDWIVPCQRQIYIHPIFHMGYFSSAFQFGRVVEKWLSASVYITIHRWPSAQLTFLVAQHFAQMEKLWESLTEGGTWHNRSRSFPSVVRQNSPSPRSVVLKTLRSCVCVCEGSQYIQKRRSRSKVACWQSMNGIIPKKQFS